MWEGCCSGDATDDFEFGGGAHFNDERFFIVDRGFEGVGGVEEFQNVALVIKRAVRDLHQCRVFREWSDRVGFDERSVPPEDTLV